MIFALNKIFYRQEIASNYRDWSLELGARNICIVGVKSSDVKIFCVYKGKFCIHLPNYFNPYLCYCKRESRGHICYVLNK